MFCRISTGTRFVELLKVQKLADIFRLSSSRLNRLIYDRVRAALAGCDAYLARPITDEVLGQVLRQNLNNVT